MASLQKALKSNIKNKYEDRAHVAKMMAKAEELITQRRLKIRHKKIDTLKDVLLGKKDYLYKTNLIDKTIEQEFKFFGSAAKKEDL